MLPGFSLVIPAFNEADRIGKTLREAIEFLQEFSPSTEIIVVDDGSTDATAAVVRQVFDTAGGLEARLIERPPNSGKGAAVRAGLLAATRSVGLFSDADFSTPIEEAPKLLDPIFADELDVAFGSRALNRGLIGNRQAWHREQAGRVFNLAVRMMTGLPFWDTQCGFKAFRLDALRPLLPQARSDGFGFDVELLYLAHKANLRMREIPVRWNHHEGSKVRMLHDSAHMLQEVIALRMRA
ncbi:MAG: glycosyltransferase family 2 protein [Chthoniobacterales bacterium]|nr:glycosyltransferase family 2 protein [Chthoniobacterales bacterium]